MKRQLVPILLGAILAAAAPAAGPAKPAADGRKFAIASGPFRPEWESLKTYRCPEWFRDAKLGIWAHWGPQAVPMEGDWYARQMYIQGHPQYKDHLKRYGHPSKHGYKDLIPLWKAEKWDPDALMALYRKAGARYFVSMGVHHDNFDLWDSAHHRWNAVRMGPKRDVVGTWQKAARKQGLRFGVSEHLGASFTWFQTSHGADKTGPKAGIPYDGADSRYQDLYHPPAARDDKGWYSKDPRWHREWFARIKDLVDHYHPDLLYTDGPVPFGPPFDNVGRSLIAHLYNADAGRHGGRAEAVYTCKQESRGMWVQDLERGVMAGVRPEPWQTDTSIGDWFYNKHWKYRGADWVIHTLADVVSKNGNLLLNVVQRPDGSLDPQARKVLDEMADWMAVNGEAIYNTRPWRIHGEGPVRARGGSFGEDFAYSARDIRFTTKGDHTLYAIALGWPADRKVVVHALGRVKGVTGRATAVKLLGHAGAVRWSHTADGLAVELPDQPPSRYAVVLKVTVSDLGGFKPELAAPASPVVQADARGGYRLDAADAELHGQHVRVENRGGRANVGFWDDPKDWVSWQVNFKQPGRYRVTARCATVNGGAAFVVRVGGGSVEGRAEQTGSWDRFRDVVLGTVEVPKAGRQTVTMRPKDARGWRAINLRRIKLDRQDR